MNEQNQSISKYSEWAQTLLEKQEISSNDISLLLDKSQKQEIPSNHPLNERILLSIARNPGAAIPYLDQVAQFCLQCNQPESAAKLFEFASKKSPNNQNLQFNLAWYLEKSGEHEKALSAYNELLVKYSGDQFDTKINIAKILSEQLAREDEAIIVLKNILADDPCYAPAMYNLGNIHEQKGERTVARNYFESTIKHNPSMFSALARIAGTHTFEAPEDPLIAKMILSLKTQQLNYDDAVDMLYAIGTAFDQCEAYEQAAIYFRHANELNAQSHPAYISNLEQEKIQSIINSSPKLRSTKSKETPIFICGHFRSGSTLCEQILSKHKNITALGESDFFLKIRNRKLNKELSCDEIENEYTENIIIKMGKGKRTTDKRPDNILSLDLIKSVYPKAKIIITTRNQMDNALSIYFQRFGPSMNYSCSLDSIKEHFSNIERLTEHWKNKFGDDIHIFEYEKLIQDTEDSIRNVLKFIDEEYDPNCMNFDSSSRTVKTASVWQVRQPIHQKSNGRWKNYINFFKNLATEDPNNVNI